MCFAFSLCVFHAFVESGLFGENGAELVYESVQNGVVSGYSKSGYIVAVSCFVVDELSSP